MRRFPNAQPPRAAQGIRQPAHIRLPLYPPRGVTRRNPEVTESQVDMVHSQSPHGGNRKPAGVNRQHAGTDKRARLDNEPVVECEVALKDRNARIMGKDNRA